MLQPPDRFEALFAMAMHLHGTPEGAALSWDAAAKAMHELARHEQSLPPDLNHASVDLAPADLADARLAVYAFVDEMLFRSPRPGEMSGLGWSPHTLQNRYFGTNDGGELFYERLEVLLARLEREPAPEQKDVPMQPPGMRLLTPVDAHAAMPLIDRLRAAASRVPETAAQRSGYAALAVFAQCLAFGFRGRLYTHDEQVRELRDTACSLLTSAWAPLPPVETALPARKLNVPFLADCEPLLHVLAPLAITVAWYVFCADIIIRAVPF